MCYLKSLSGCWKSIIGYRMMKEYLTLTNWYIEFLIAPEECLSCKKICLIYEESGISFIDLNYYTAKECTLVIPSLIVLRIFEISPLKDI